MSTREEFKWPSERVCPGGLFHPAKVKYSKETNDILKLLMEEAKLSMFLRKKINYHLRNGEPLPSTGFKSKRTNYQQHSNIDFEMRLRSHLARRRSYEQIKASGAFEKSKYHPPPNLRIPSELAKLQLQEKMSGMKIYSENSKVKIKSKKENHEINLDIDDQIDELLEEISERVDWLEEMEKLGEGKKYRNMIKLQIQERFRQIKILEKRKEAAENK